MPRTTREIIHDHLERRQEGDLEGDLEQNYATDVVLMSAEGKSHGHEGILSCNRILREHIPGTEYEYLNVLVHEDLGFLQWRATGNGRTFYGADTYVVSDDKIAVQTIHFYGSEPS